MPINIDKPHLWKADIASSVDFYNKWFMEFAPKAFRETRVKTTEDVKSALEKTDNLQSIDTRLLQDNPSVLPMLRMSTCPPIARDRLAGLAYVPRQLIESMEKKKRIPPRMSSVQLESNLSNLTRTISLMADRDIFAWLDRRSPPTDEEINRAAAIVADRLCGAESDPIIRNAQERRQLASIGRWLEERGYDKTSLRNGMSFRDLATGSYAFRVNVPVMESTGTKRVNVPVDVVITNKNAQEGDFPIFLEAKSSGDYTNPNKRRKEEAQKMSQFRRTYRDKIKYILFLCGYFDSGYLGYEAAEGIDWVWEHRIEDLAKIGL